MILIFIFIFYQIIQVIFLPIFIIFLIIRFFRGKNVFGNFKERFGFVPKIKFNKNLNKNIYWIHAVSVGEILSIQDFINKIQKEIPDSICYITTGTLTGKKIAQENLKTQYISFLPFDFLIPIYLVYKRIKPKALIIIEAELWPNLLILSKFLKIPAYSLNARISDRSQKKYFNLKFILSPIINIYKIIFTQSEQDKLNFIKMGIKPEKLVVLGNIKALNVIEKKEKIILNYNPEDLNNYKILLAGSIHPGELDIYLDLFIKLKPKFNNLKLILAPRHFNWIDILVKKLDFFNLNYYSWDNSTKNINLKKIFNNHDILLILKLGELFKIYPACSIFYLGGTFVPIGGHNLLEPAVWQKLSIIGPNYFNCKDIANKLENNNGLIKVNNFQELFNNTEELLLNQNKINLMSKSSYIFLEQEAIKVQKNLNSFVNILKK